jgi:hypothetical protein
MTARSASRKHAFLAFALVAGLAVAATWALRSQAGGARGHAGRSETAATRLTHAEASPETFDRAIPSSIQPATYKEVAVGTTQTGEPFRIFTGRKQASAAHFANSGCFGLRTPNVIGTSCGVDLERGVGLQAMETTFRGHRMVAGLVSEAVAKVVITNVVGRDVPVPVHSGTFFFERPGGESVRAYASDGRLLGAYILDTSSR